MKTLKLSLVSLLAVLTLSAAPSSVCSQCSSANTGVLGWWPKFFEDADSCGCTVSGMIDSLLGGAARLDANAVYYAHDDLNKPPEPLTTLANEAPSRRTLFIKTHGYASAFAAVYYNDENSRNAAYDQLVQAGWRDNYHIAKLDEDPAPSIYVLNAGISEKIAGSMDPQRIVGAFHCYSYPGTMSSWGVSPGGPGTFYGYSYVDCDANCEVVQTIIARMGCYSFPMYGHQTDDAVRGIEGLVTLAGNRKNQYNCSKSCWNWDVDFLDAHADRASGTINWAVRGEDVETRYLVRGYPGRDADPKVLLTMEGQGRDGYGMLSAYSVPMPDGRFDYFDVVEIDGAGRRTPSDPLALQS